jgi:hypothetical protein
MAIGKKTVPTIRKPALCELMQIAATWISDGNQSWMTSPTGWTTACLLATLDSHMIACLLDTLTSRQTPEQPTIRGIPD